MAGTAWTDTNDGDLMPLEGHLGRAESDWIMIESRRLLTSARPPVNNGAGETYSLPASWL